MNKVVKLRAFFQLIILYCFIVSTCSTGLWVPLVNSQNVSSARELGYLPITGVDLFNNTTKPENVLNIFRNPLFLSFKIHLSDIGTYLETVDSMFFNKSSQYIFYAVNGITRFQPIDIIFPFHYFW